MDTTNSEPRGRAPGQVLAFYSYKGGTGRTMALVNTACLLARNSQGRVLLIDWDLEAPGLHHYFAKVPGDAAKQGLLELVSSASRQLQGVSAEDSPDADVVWQSAWEELDVGTQIVSATGIDGVEYIRAGAFTEDYGDRVSDLDWKRLFRICPDLFPALARRLASEFEWILIDARTGTTDTTGICTMLMPDKLVVVFTPNRQSLEGIAALTRRAVNWRMQYGEARPLLVYPLPSRIDSVYDTLRKRWRYGDDGDDIAGYQPLFERALADAYCLEQCSLEAYFNEVQVQHAPEFAYGERIAVHEPQNELTEDRFSMVRSYQSLLDWLAEGIPAWEDRERWRAMTELMRVDEELDSFPTSRSASDKEFGTQLIQLRSRRREAAAMAYGAESADAAVSAIQLAAAQAEFTSAEEASNTLARHSLAAADTDVSALQAMGALANALFLAGHPQPALAWAIRARDGLNKLLEPQDPRSVSAAKVWFSILVRSSSGKVVDNGADIQQRLVPPISYPSRTDYPESPLKGLAQPPVSLDDAASDPMPRHL